MCRDALTREESCGGHFREEYQTSEGEVWDMKTSLTLQFGNTNLDNEPVRHIEPLEYKNVKLATRSYK